MSSSICEEPGFEHGIEALDALVGRSGEIVLCAHTNPDGDAVGSVLAMAALIERRWPEAHVVRMLADRGPVPAAYRFLPGSGSYVEAASYEGTPDLFVCVDLPSADRRLADARPVAERAKALAVVDHHPTDDASGEVRISRPDAAATGVIVYEAARHVGIELTPDVAQCLLCAIVTDTGRFQYQNTDGEAFQVASQLVDAGASPSEISLHVYQSFRIEYLHLEALVMGRIKTCLDGRIAYSHASYEDIRDAGVSPDECDGLIDVVRTVEGTDVALFVKEVEPGKVRGNLRAKGDQDVSEAARQLGGGGHKAAAGFTFDGTPEEAISKMLPLLERMLEGTEASA
ncbi:MAG: bifunctional oligoribonuclease/PAP phosphatase NrnA [Atopobiaceae bacterium]|nr:bifunctional oligoribonuclease/PAP phosphatase NrnA [Atopobiaceae bacterium]MCI1317762.1 bifunctional oligoribonuclease/PAP phosphatase NrnA [Atopobiaceae bacterium]MCI1388337.1 bifunctional oligoribonuclease/PAP phosphatase NrnA [Atopobiaceae bacterium]MCI1431413.1 bifunctional oligoribonuclease/PAP phosphatase NrnA [Atopobiaceae bacterium]MCI1469849.1 bifunctional oligoribonuclease/PAP phosphatase NrnA [Atopobiaceae bacterium]